MINRRPPAAPAPDTNRHLALFAVVAVVALLAGCSASASESRPGGGTSGVLMPAAGESTRASRAVPDQLPAQRGGVREKPGFVDGSAPRSTDSVTPYLPPASARQQSMIGAEAFVRFFWASVESSLANPEFGAIEPYYLASCSQCARLDDRIGDLAEAGYQQEGGKIVIGPMGGATDRDRSVRLAYRRTETAHDLVGLQGDRRYLGAVHRIDTMTLVWRDDGWRVASLAIGVG